LILQSKAGAVHSTGRQPCAGSTNSRSTTIRPDWIGRFDLAAEHQKHQRCCLSIPILCAVQPTNAAAIQNGVRGTDEQFYAEGYAPLLKPVKPDIDIEIVPSVGHMGAMNSPAMLEAVRRTFTSPLW